MLGENLSHRLSDDILNCLLNFYIHDNPLTYFSEYASLLSKPGFIPLIIDTGFQFGIKYRPEKKYIVGKKYQKYREELINQIFTLYDNIKESQINKTNFMHILNKYLSDPKECIKIITRKSSLTKSMFLLQHEEKSIKNELSSYLEEDIEYYNSIFENLTNKILETDFPSDEIIVRKFLYESTPKKFAEREYLWLRFINLYRFTKIEERFPLLISDYNLHVHPGISLSIAKPIEEIIIQSTRKPSLIYRLTPREFEKFLAEIFKAFGYNVQLTSRSRDGGVDILCMEMKHEIPFKIAVEAKRYHKSQPVTVELVRSFIGANKLIQANKLVYVTTSRYTKDAILYATSPFNIQLLELKELPDIVKWAKEYKKIKHPFS